MCRNLQTVLLTMAAIGVWAGENGEDKNAGMNPLAGLPSKPGPHLARIEAMPDNSWLKLGQATPADSEKGVACGRSYSPKMAYAPDLRGAFLCGTGRHGVTVRGRYMDDLWFYDCMAHQWICLYPGASRDTQLKLNKHGFEVKEDGENNPVSYLSHGYNNVTYNPHLKKYMLMYTMCPWWKKALPQRAKWLGVSKEAFKNPYSAGKLNISCRHPVFWDVVGNRWERIFVKGSVGPDRRCEGVLEYIPYRKQAFFLFKGYAYFYDFANQKWIRSAAKRARIEYEPSGCYDTKRERIYVIRNNMWYYDLKTDVWKTVRGKDQRKNLYLRRPMTYDSVSGVVNYMLGDTPLIYDPEINAWTRGAKAPVATAKHLFWNAFYNPKLNVHYYYVARDSSTRGAIMLAYRYKRAVKE